MQAEEKKKHKQLKNVSIHGKWIHECRKRSVQKIKKKYNYILLVILAKTKQMCN